MLELGRRPPNRGRRLRQTVGQDAARDGVRVAQPAFRPAADEIVTPGEVRYAVVVSTAREQAAAVALQHALTLVQASRALSPELIDVTEHQLRLSGQQGAAGAPV